MQQELEPAEHRLPITRSARVYSLGAVAAPDAWVVLHGYAQLAGRFLRQFAGIAGAQRGVVAPEALNRFYVDPPQPGGPPASERRVGTTWMTREDRDAEIADYVAYLDRVREQLVPRAERLTVLGFSQGVATACRWFAFGASTIDRLILWAGPIPNDLDLRLMARRAGGLTVEIVLGTQDEFSGFRNVDEELDLLRQAGVNHRLISFDGGHRIDAGVLTALASA